jgi:hypothetical protein
MIYMRDGEKKSKRSIVALVALDLKFEPIILWQINTPDDLHVNDRRNENAESCFYFSTHIMQQIVTHRSNPVDGLLSTEFASISLTEHSQLHRSPI